jgi:predicted DNA-binding transcriptional regulator AlpA
MENPDLLSHDAVLAFFGGSNKPIHWSTMARGMVSGKYPRPINIGGYRWLRSECDAAIERMIAERDARFPKRRLVSALAE